jgi:hypothetical protein
MAARPMLAFALVLLACEQAKTEPEAVEASLAVAYDPQLSSAGDFPRPLNPPAYECSLTTALQIAVPSAEPEVCGLLSLGASHVEIRRAVDCMDRAEFRRRSFVVARQWYGTDSDIARAHLVRFDGGARTLYEASYDDYGGLGGTTVKRCRTSNKLSNLFDSEWHDGQCIGGEVVERCGLGSRSAVPRLVAESLRDQLFAATPGRLSAILAPFRLGAPASHWDSVEVRRTIQWVESGGIVAVAERHPAAFVLVFAGPCARVRAMLDSKWGPSAADTWVDHASNRRATFSLAGCSLRIERADY